MVDFMDKLQQLSEIGMSAKDKQGLINVSEAFYAWDIMVTKFDILESIHITENFIDDIDLRLMAIRVIGALEEGIAGMEKIMDSYAIPFPIRPPTGSKTTKNMEYFTDRYIYQNLYVISLEVCLCPGWHIHKSLMLSKQVRLAMVLQITPQSFRKCSMKQQKRVGELSMSLPGNTGLTGI